MTIYSRFKKIITAIGRRSRSVPDGTKKLAFALPIVFVGLVILLAVFAPTHAYGQAAGVPGTSSGGGGFLGDIAYFLIGKLCLGIAFIISWICGVFIGIEAYFVGFVLNLNSGVFESFIVKTGFSVSLSLANLGFVFGIIVIAIATILRNQTYGIKQILWKLVVMAILVNFGLVIMSTIFNFTDQFTNYFLNQISPATIDSSGKVVSTNYNNFASDLAGAFNPQQNFLPQENKAASTTLANVGTDFGKLLVPILSLGFTVASLIVIIITLAVFAVMLLIRYVYIAVLAVLLPFAWMLWVFPKTKDNFDKWWSEFIRWTIFAPIVLFFLWLALNTAHGLSVGAPDFTSPGPDGKDSFWVFLVPIVKSLLNEIVLVGLMVGGMIAANSLGIKGAKEALGAMNNVGKAVGSYAARQGRKAGRAGYQKIGGEKITTAMQEGRLGGGLKRIAQKPFENVPGRRGKFLRAVAGVPGGVLGSVESLTGRGLASVSTNQKMVEEAKKRVPENPEEIRKNLRGSMSKEEQFAHITKLVEKGELREKKEDGTDEMINGKTVREFLNKNLDAENDITRRYGQVVLGMNANKTIGSDKAMRDADSALKTAQASGNPNARDDAMKALDKATTDFVSKLQKADISKINVNSIFTREGTELSKALARGFLNNAPQLTSSLLPKMKSPALKQFGDTYIKEIDVAREKIINDKRLIPSDNKAALDKLKKTEDSFRQSLLNNALFSSPETPATPPASPASPKP